MAKIRDYAVSINAAAAASIAVEMPVHETGDLLLCWFNKDTAGSGPSTPSGWSVPTVWGSNPLNSTGSGNYLFAKRATSSAEALGSVSYTSETALCIVIAIRGCYGSTVDDAVSTGARSGADDSALPLDGGTLTPGYNNSLVLSLLGTDSGIGPFCLPGWSHLYGGDTGANSLAVSYTFQRTAAALTHPGYWAGVADDSRWGILAIRDGSSGADVDAYLDRATVPATLLAPLVMSGTPDKGTWELVTNDITSVTLTNGGSSTTLTQVDPVAAADSGYDPFLAATRVVAASSTSAMNASQLRRTANDDLTLGEGVIFGTWRPQVPRDYLDMGKPVAGGVAIMIADASNNYRMWCIGGQLSRTTKVSDRQNFAIEVATEDTDFAESATNPTLSAIQDWYFAGSGYFGAASAEWSGLYLLNLFVLAGGSSSAPMAFADVVAAVNAGGGFMPYIELAGAAGTIWVPLRFGGGEACHVRASLSVFQFPTKADGSRYLDHHLSSNKHGIEFYGQDRGSGDVDTLAFTNCVFTSGSPYYWRFHASHDADAVVDFGGSTVVGATVTLRATVTLARVTFIACPSFTSNGAALSACVFSDTKVLAASPAEAAALSGCAFTKTTGTAHAIEIGGTAANISLSGCTFTGYAASNGSTGNEAIYVNIGSGNMVISITGGGATPSIRTAGATVTVSNNRTVTLTGLQNPSEVRVYGAGTTTEVSGTGAESVTDGDHSFNVALGTHVDIVILALGYQNMRILDYIVAADATLPVSQALDRQYSP